MLRRHCLILALTASAIVLTAATAHAIDIAMVPVGNPGNPADGSGFGAVSYDYLIGKYDVTVAQYVQFLSAVAKADPCGLYSNGMAGALPTVGILQTGSSPNYSYSVVGGYNGTNSAGANFPMFDVTWGDAARFCNWLQNGQPAFSAGTPGEVAGSTETGAYTLNGDTTTLLETRNTGATYFLPSEDEWYKAAYYNPNTGTYWTYPTQSYSNNPPSNALSTIGTNNANYHASGYTDATNYLTQVGSFASSPGPYGTYDMGGDVFQWNEAVVGSARGFRGGAWYSSTAALASSNRGDIIPTYADYGMGFRVASVPEPSTVVLLLAALAGLTVWRRVKK